MDNDMSFAAVFEMSVTEMDSSLKSLIDRVDHRKPICFCGHPIVGHRLLGNRSICSFAGMLCSCKNPSIAIEAPDLRYFKKLTRGSGSRHALALGIYSSIKAGKPVRWISEPSCHKCNVANKLIKPLALNSDGRVANSSGEYNILSCQDCLLSFS